MPIVQAAIPPIRYFVTSEARSAHPRASWYQTVLEAVHVVASPPAVWPL